jgi:5-methyltetrahydropteroyltriglutamate--homocysteine methyltransferase
MIRPASVRAFNERVARGEAVDAAAYNATLRQAVGEVVRRQAAVGVDVVSDGEFGKPGWAGYSIDRLSGFEIRPVVPARVGYLGWEAEGRFKDFYDQAGPPRHARHHAVCVGPITYTDAGRAAMRRDVANLKAALADVEVEDAFLPVVAPASFEGYYSNEYYRTDEEFIFAVAEAQHEEYRLITDAGLMVQVDDAILLNLHDIIVDSGKDYRRWVAMNVEALNHALRGIPEEKVRYHLCWGSWPGPHTSDVPLAEIIDLVLKINCQAYSIEAANPRHEWEWVVWQETKLPDGKILMPGMVSHAIAHVEHPELIAQRIRRYADLVGDENVIASSDCGFAQNAAIGRQHPEIVWAKLEALAEGARIASRSRSGQRM